MHGVGVPSYTTRTDDLGVEAYLRTFSVHEFKVMTATWRGVHKQLFHNVSWF